MDTETEHALAPEVKIALTTLVAHLLLYEVDAETLEILRQDDVLEVLEKLAPGCRESLAEKEWSAEDFDAAAAEYCKLFVLPKGVVPYATAWLGGDPLVSGPRIAAEVDEMMRRLGIEEIPGNPPCDHLGVLLTLATRAWQAGPEGEEVGRALAADLLLPWVADFGAALQKSAESPLYRALGALLGALAGML